MILSEKEHGVFPPQGTMEPPFSWSIGCVQDKLDELGSDGPWKPGQSRCSSYMHSREAGRVCKG